MAKCSFCSKQAEPGRGVTYVALDRVITFCSPKCMKNFHMGRDRRRVTWIKKSHAAKEVLKQELLAAAKESEEKAAEKQADKKSAGKK